MGVQACIFICWIGTVGEMAEGTHMPLGNTGWRHGVAEQGAWGGVCLCNCVVGASVCMFNNLNDGRFKRFIVVCVCVCYWRRSNRPQGCR